MFRHNLKRKPLSQLTFYETYVNAILALFFTDDLRINFKKNHSIVYDQRVIAFRPGFKMIKNETFLLFWP